MKHLIAILACVAILVVPGGPSVLDATSRAAERDKSSTPRPVEITSCRILQLHTAVLASHRPGVLLSVKPEEGDLIQNDETIAELHDEVVRANLAIAEVQALNDIEIRYAIAAAEVAEKMLDAAEEANNSRGVTAVPEIEVERLRLDFKRATLQIEKARKDLNVFGLQRDKELAELKTHQVRAPFSGIVTKRYKSTGEAVQQGEPIIELVNTDYVKVEGNIELDDLFRVKPGSAVKVQLNLSDDLLEEDLEKYQLRQDKDTISRLRDRGAVPEEELRTFDGVLVFVDVSATGLSGRVRVWAKVKNEDNILRDGLRARMTIYPHAPKTNTTTARSTP